MSAPITCTGTSLDEALVEFPFGLEKSTANRLIKSGELPARKLGRKWYARRSAVLGLIDAAPRPRPRTTGAAVKADLAAIAARQAEKASP